MNQTVQLFAYDLPSGATQGSWVMLDTDGDEPIKMTMSVLDVYEPMQNTAAFSKPFSLYHTPTNAEFFKSAFSVNGQDYDPTAHVSAYLNVDGSYFMSGSIHLQAVYDNRKFNTVRYDVVFMGETSTLGTSIVGNLCELNFGGTGTTGGYPTGTGYNLNHEFNYNNVINSWQASTTGSSATGILGGDIIYPLIEWGYTYNDLAVPTIPTVSLTGATGAVMSFTRGATYGIWLDQLKPAIRAKRVVDAIFNEAGFSYESEWMDTAEFLDLYLVSDREPRARAGVAGEWKVVLQPNQPSTYDGTDYEFKKSYEVYDVQDNFQGNYFYVPNGGLYNFNISLPIAQYGTAGTSHTWDFKLKTQNGAVVGATSIGVTAQGKPVGSVYSGGVSTIENPSVKTWIVGATLAAGDIVRLTASQNDTQNISTYSYTDPIFYPGVVYTRTFYSRVINASWTCLTFPSNVVRCLPCDKTKLSFIKSLIDRFKLVFVPSKTIKNHFEIEPWKDWINQGDVKDWSDKLDTSKDFVFKPAFYTQSKIIEFIDKEDTDVVNFAYQQNNKVPFGRIKLDSGITLINGEKKVESIFAPTPLDIIGNSAEGASAWILPHLGKLTPGGDGKTAKIEPIAPQPRLVYWNGLKTTPKNWYLKNGTGLTATGMTQSSFPLVSSFSTWTGTMATGPDSDSTDLHWGQLSATASEGVASPVSVYDYTTYTINTRVQNTAYVNYWKLWFDNFLNAYGTDGDAKWSRTAEAYFKLSVKDIIDLKFNDKIWVKDSWWYVTKVLDWTVGSNNVCKVELLKINNTYGLYNNEYPVEAPVCTGCYSFTVTNDYLGDNIAYYTDCENNYHAITITMGGSAVLCSCFAPIGDNLTVSNTGTCTEQCYLWTVTTTEDGYGDYTPCNNLPVGFVMTAFVPQQFCSKNPPVILSGGGTVTITQDAPC